MELGLGSRLGEREGPNFRQNTACVSAFALSQPLALAREGGENEGLIAG